ncbi:MAG: SPOR domain-containing protein [Magnetococcus sp. DMHC-6]
MSISHTLDSKEARERHIQTSQRLGWTLVVGYTIFFLIAITTLPTGTKRVFTESSTRAALPPTTDFLLPPPLPAESLPTTTPLQAEPLTMATIPEVESPPVEERAPPWPITPPTPPPLKVRPISPIATAGDPIDVIEKIPTMPLPLPTTTMEPMPSFSAPTHAPASSLEWQGSVVQLSPNGLQVVKTSQVRPENLMSFSDAIRQADFPRPEKGRIMVQVGSFMEHDLALSRLKHLTSKGIPGHIQAIETKGKELFYVEVGPYALESSAKQAERLINEKTGIPASHTFSQTTWCIKPAPETPSKQLIEPCP